MSIVSLRKILLSYGPHPLMDQVDLTIEKGERICLIGRNGMGKSTLLKIIAGLVQPDAGLVERAQGVIVAYLPQNIPKDFVGTIYDVVASGLGDIGQWLIQYDHVNRLLAETGDEKLLQQSARIQHEIDACDGWSLGQRVDKILSMMSLPGDVDVSSLSGGMTRRVLLAKALVQEPDLLILDEPTNHLDIEAIDWLENFLQNYKKALLFVSHDRAFMQALATRVLELDHGVLTSWVGRYHAFLEHKASMLAALETQQALFDKRLAQEEVWIRQGIKARRTRNEGRVRALKKMREERRGRRERLGQVKFTANDFGESGKIVFALEHVSQQYGAVPLIKDFSTTIMRGDKIGIIGPNGAGKSTLIKILLGQLVPQQGKAMQGTRLEIGYFDQHREILDENKTVQENVYAGGDMIVINGKSTHVLSYLQDFLFSPQRARSPVKVLSGGERNRLLLARLFTRAVNVLIMDEPTNDLDIETLELLEEQLTNYSGTLLLVSHDREFLDHVVTSTLVFEGDGQIGEYVGGYEDWQRQKAITKTKSEPKPVVQVVTKPSVKSKLSYKEKTELDALPSQIQSLENQIQQAQQRMSDPSFYQQPAEKLALAHEELAKLEDTLRRLYARWEELDS